MRHRALRWVEVHLEWWGLEMSTEFWWGILLEKDKLEDNEKGVWNYDDLNEAILEVLIDWASSGLC